MSENWQVGDLALCMADRWCKTIDLPNGATIFSPCHGPKRGSIHTVRRVGFSEQLGLWLEGWPGESICHAFAATCFRKINPHEPDEEDAETIRLLNGQPAKVDA